MPWWPIMMPSEAVGAPKICGTPPPARTPSHALAGEPVEVGVARGDVAEQRRDADHRAGRSRRRGTRPPRSMARFGARPGPPVVVRLLRVARSAMRIILATGRRDVDRVASACYPRRPRDLATPAREVFLGDAEMPTERGKNRSTGLHRLCGVN